MTAALFCRPRTRNNKTVTNAYWRAVPNSPALSGTVAQREMLRAKSLSLRADLSKIEMRDRRRLRTDVGFADAMKFATNFRRSDSPPWTRRGGRDIKQDAAKPPLRSGRGGSFNYELIGDLNQPPRPLHQRRLRIIFLMSRPPLLGQGGEFPCFKRWATAPAKRGELRRLVGLTNYFGQLCG